MSADEGFIWHVRDARHVEREVRKQGRATGETEIVSEDGGVERPVERWFATRQTN